MAGPWPVLPGALAAWWEASPGGQDQPRPAAGDVEGQSPQPGRRQAHQRSGLAAEMLLCSVLLYALVPGRGKAVFMDAHQGL